MSKQGVIALINTEMTDCVMLDKITVSDGYGGYYSQWVDGAQFMAAFDFNTSIEARTADVQGVTSLYTVTTSRSFMLQYHDVFKRLSDGKIFRSTSDGDDKATPRVASLDMRQVTAEEYKING